MKIEIRKATHSDATTLSLLARITYKEAFGNLWENSELVRYLDVTFSVSKIEGSLRKDNNYFWLVFANDLPVGYAKLKMDCPFEKLNSPAQAQLQKIYLLTDYTGRRIGEQLQDKVFSTGRESHVATLWLAVWVYNDKAIRFYERHGFVKTTNYRYEFLNTYFDYHIMTKSL